MMVRQELERMGIEEPQLSKLTEWVFDAAVASTASIDSVLYVVRWAYQSRKIDYVNIRAKLQELVRG